MYSGHRIKEGVNGQRSNNASCDYPDSAGADNVEQAESQGEDAMLFYEEG